MTTFLLARFERFLLLLFESCLARPRVTLAVAACAVLAAASRLPSLSTVVSVADFLDEGFPSVAALRSLQTDFGMGQSAIVLFRRGDGAPLAPSDLCAARAALEREAQSNPRVLRVDSPFEARQTVRTPDRLLYLPLVELSCDPLEWETPFIRERATRAAALPGGPLEALARGPLAPAYVSPAKDALVAHVHFHDAGDRAHMGSFDPADVRVLATRLEASSRVAKYPGLRVDVTGLARHQERLLAGIEDDRVLNLAAGALLIILCRVLLGRVLGGLFLVGTLSVAVIVTFGTLAAFGGKVDMLTNGLFVLLSVATLQDVLFLAGEMRARGPTGWKGAFRTMLVPSFFTSFTTIVGFGSLAATTLPVLRKFGLLVAWGVFIEWAVVFLVVPSLLALVPRLRVWSAPRPAPPPVPADFGRHGEPGVHLPADARVPLLSHLLALTPSRGATLALSLAIPLSAIGLVHLRSGDTPLEVFPSSHPHRRVMSELKGAFGFETEASLVFHSPSARADDEATRRDAQRVIERVRAHPAVAAVITPWDVRDALTAGLPDTDVALVHREVAHSDAYGHWFRDASAGGVSKARAVVLLKTSDSDAATDLEALVANECGSARCALAGDVVAFAAFTREVTGALIESLFVGLLLATLVLLFLARALARRDLWPMTLASLWGPLVTIGILGFSPLRVNFVTSVLAAAVVGLAGDNAIQFWFASRRAGAIGAHGTNRGVERRGEATLQLTACMILASLLLCLSVFAPPRALGCLLAASFALMAAGDLWLLRGYLAHGLPWRCISRGRG